VHIYRFALDLPAERLAELRGVLSEGETRRAARYRDPADQARFTAAHGQLRQVLAACLDTLPAALVFVQNQYGKPALAGESGLRFNLSHSRGMGLLAVSQGQELGVDIESIRADTDRVNISRRFFSPREAAELLAMPPHQQVRAFYACWTRKEAYVKGRGQGLSLALNEFEVSVSPDEPPVLILPGPDQQPGEVWTLHDIAVGPGFSATLAVEGRIEGIRCWEWGL
jgi:4'-phosphopantetheinyl transferase